MERVARQPDGGYRADLRNPQAPQDLAVVEWPASAGNRAVGVKVGDVLDVTPAPADAGWTVANANGAALGLLPTTTATATGMSERF